MPLIFCGKGGVGKTTLVCATALHIAVTEPHRRTHPVVLQ